MYTCIKLILINNINIFRKVYYLRSGVYVTQKLRDFGPDFGYRGLMTCNDTLCDMKTKC